MRDAWKVRNMTVRAPPASGSGSNSSVDSAILCSIEGRRHVRRCELYSGNRIGCESARIGLSAEQTCWHQPQLHTCRPAGYYMTDARKYEMAWWLRRRLRETCTSDSPVRQIESTITRKACAMPELGTVHRLQGDEVAPPWGMYGYHTAEYTHYLKAAAKFDHTRRFSLLPLAVCSHIEPHQSMHSDRRMH